MNARLFEALRPTAAGVRAEENLALNEAFYTS